MSALRLGLSKEFVLKKADAVLAPAEQQQADNREAYHKNRAKPIPLVAGEQTAEPYHRVNSEAIKFATIRLVSAV